MDTKKLTLEITVAPTPVIPESITIGGKLYLSDVPFDPMLLVAHLTYSESGEGYAWIPFPSWHEAIAFFIHQDWSNIDRTFVRLR